MSAPPPPGGRGRAVRAWLAVAALLVLAGGAARLHNASAYPALRDFDGAGHALNTYALYRGELPDPRSWSGFHPPLAYAAGAAVWHLAPERVPVHVQLRLLSALWGALAVLVTWRVLRRRVPEPDAALVAALAWCAPVTIVATSMIGNEMLCALLVTLALAWLVRGAPPGREIRHHAVSGLLAGASVLAKATGLVAVAAAAVHALVTLRARPARALGAAALCGALALLVAAPQLARLAAAGGSPLAVVSGGGTSPDARAAMARQPPGIREPGDYLSFPPATLRAPLYLDRDLARSVPGLLYASTWADAHAQFLEPGRGGPVLRAEAWLATAGLVPTALAALGLGVALRRRDASWTGPLAFLGLLAVAFVRYVWVFPQYAAVKASYFLPALLPAAYLLALGLTRWRGGVRTALRAYLAALAAASTAVFWYGWWS